MNTKNLAKRVRAQLGAEPVSTLHVAERCGISTANALYYLNQLVEAGDAIRETQVVHHLETKASSRRYTFRLVEQPVAESATPATPPAYRNLRLSENLTNYDRTNHDFAALCMMVRK
jgi:hypothetical protein